MVPNDFDETFNLSIKSVDYDGDSEDSLDSENYFDESFSVGRSRLSSYHSVEEFSDDETTMDADMHFVQNRQPSFNLPKENFTPIFHSFNNEHNVFFDHQQNLQNQEQFAVNIHFVDDMSANSRLPSQHELPSCSKSDHEKRIAKRKQSTTDSRNPVGKRTRSSSTFYK